MGTRYVNVGDMDTDYVDNDGNIVKNDDTKIVMVRTKLDLPLFSGYSPGTLAYTAGFNNIWQLDANGEWKTIIEEDESDG